MNQAAAQDLSISLQKAFNFSDHSNSHKSVVNFSFFQLLINYWLEYPHYDQWYGYLHAVVIKYNHITKKILEKKLRSILSIMICTSYLTFTFIFYGNSHPWLTNKVGAAWFYTLSRIRINFWSRSCGNNTLTIFFPFYQRQKRIENVK